MNTKNNPAFPPHIHQFPDTPQGLTKLEWFAGMALQMAGAYTISMLLGGNKAALSQSDIITKAYELAEGMLAEAEKRE